MTNPKGFTQKSCFINIQAPEIVVPVLLKKKTFNDPVIISSRPETINFTYINQLKKTFGLFNF
jgi:hypothetical protein